MTREEAWKIIEEQPQDVKELLTIAMNILDECKTPEERRQKRLMILKVCEYVMKQAG